jgi:predicted enzyme related to lactoylglutathione lyase
VEAGWPGADFYGQLLGWTFEDAMPPGSPISYLIAKLDGQDIGGIAPTQGTGYWNTYIAVDDCDASAAAAAAHGGKVEFEPADAGPGGRWAAIVDPDGAPFRLWQARQRLGSQVANVPSAWNFSILQTADMERSMDFYSSFLGWQALGDISPGGTMVKVPGYGDHLAATVDPTIHERQATAPPGFADVVSGMEGPSADGQPRWEVKITVADRDATAELATKLDATVLSTRETMWTREAIIIDPQGARFVASQFTPPTS